MGPYEWYDTTATTAPVTKKKPAKTPVTGTAGSATSIVGAASSAAPYITSLVDNDPGNLPADEQAAGYGSAIGGTIGSIAQLWLPIPGLSEAVAGVGGLLGGAIGAEAGRKQAAKENAAYGRRRWGAFNEQANVDPYGAGNSAYMEEGGLTDMGLSMFMLNTKLPVKAKINPLDTKLMVQHGIVPGSVPSSEEIGMYAAGGLTGGGEEPKPVKKKPYNPNVYNTEDEIQAANQQAKGIIGRRVNMDDPTQAYLANNAVVARKVGDPRVPFIYPQGRPANVENLPTRLPPGITIDQVENTSEGYGYWHPQNGNFIKVDPSVYATSKQPVVPKDALAKFKKGGKTYDYYAQGGMTKGDLQTHALNQIVYDDDELPVLMMRKGGKNWIKKAVNPKHKGYCTPMTKKTCTPRRKALARTFKKHHGFHKGEDGMLTDPNQEAMIDQQGAPEEMQQAVPKTSVVNIELGELVVNPETGEIIKEFKNTSRYSKHADNPKKEPAGNFVTLPTSVVVIPRKLAKGYKEGNKLTQSSMLRQILMDQMKRKAEGEEETTPVGDVPIAQDGFYNGYGPGPMRPRTPNFVTGMWSDGTPMGDPMNPASPLFQWTPIPPNVAAPKPVNLSTSAQWMAKNYPSPTDYSAVPAYRRGVSPSQTVQDRLNTDPNFPAIGYTPGTTVGERIAARTPVTPGSISPFLQGEMEAGRYGGVDDNGGFYDNNDPSALGLVQGLQFMPAAMQLMESYRGNPDLKMVTNPGFDQARSYAAQMPTDVNYDAALGALGRQFTARNRALMNFRRSDVAGEMATAYGDTINRAGEIEMGEYNQEEQLKAAKIKTLGDLAIGQGADFQKAQLEYDLAKQQDAAARRALRHASIGESTARIAKNYMDMEKIKAGNEMTDLFKANPYMKQLIQDKPGGVEFMVNYLNETYPGMNVTPDVITSMMTETSTTVNPMTGMPKSRTNRSRTYRKPATKKNTR